MGTIRVAVEGEGIILAYVDDLTDDADWSALFWEA
jgi:hypothetical protein